MARPGRRRWLAGGLAAVALLASPLLASVAHAEDADGSIQLRVTVIDGGGTPTSPPLTEEPSAPPVSGGPPTSPPLTEEPSSPSVPSDSPPRNLASLYVSGLDTRYLPSLIPSGGDIVMSFTVESVVRESIDATSVFWATDVFGNPVGVPATVQVLALRPNETRIVTATLRNLGQSALVGVHATLSPPYRVGSTVLYPITRHALVAFLPWLGVVITILLGAGGWLLRRRVLRSLPGERSFLPRGGPV